MNIHVQVSATGIQQSTFSAWWPFDVVLRAAIAMQMVARAIDGLAFIKNKDAEMLPEDLFNCPNSGTNNGHSELRICARTRLMHRSNRRWVIRSAPKIQPRPLMSSPPAPANAA